MTVFVSLLGLFYNGTTGALTCYNITEEYVECADPTGCGTGPAALSWDFQVRCSLMPRPPRTNVFHTFAKKKHGEHLPWKFYHIVHAYAARPGLDVGNLIILISWELRFGFRIFTFINCC